MQLSSKKLSIDIQIAKNLEENLPSITITPQELSRVVVNLFNNAYPAVATVNLTPGHIGRAIGAYMATKFSVTNTPFDRYLSGETTALTTIQKQGMVVFYDRARCQRCHSGSALTNDNFEGVGTPHIGFAPFADDLGREDNTGNAVDRYKFKTPGLRNVSLSLPLMHNGAFDSIEALVDHYNDIPTSLNNYQLPTTYQANYETTIIVDTNTARNQNRLDQVTDNRLRNGLGLTEVEKASLVEFLKNGLLDTSFQD